MIHRRFGRTNLAVSAISLGTVGLGTPYGIGSSDGSGRPDDADGIRLLHYAHERGVSLFDTAPTYGTAEELVGRGLGRRNCVIATKVTLPTDGRDVASAIDESIARSRRALDREVLDVVQIHNATAAVLASAKVADTLAAQRQRGAVRFLGASVYGVADAIAAIDCGWVDVIQVAFNAMDQRMAKDVFDRATAADVGVLTRSALLKGALTRRAEQLPPPLSELRRAVERLRASIGSSWDDLPSVALRFCLAEARIASVLIGACSVAELDVAIEAADSPLAVPTVEHIRLGAPLPDELVDPRTWPPL